MKPTQKIIALAVWIILPLHACTKKSTPNNPTVTSTATNPNSISITDGSTYNASGTTATLTSNASEVVQVSITKNTSYSNLTLDVYGSHPFTIHIANCHGPANAIGDFNLETIDSSFNGFVENFSGGQTYKISGGSINVTHADVSNVTATFTINLFNSAGNKIITGSINANKPIL